KSFNLEGLKINTKIDVSEIKEAKADIFKFKEEVLSIKFIFELDYSPNIANIELKGNILLSVDSSTHKEVLKQWKNKEMTEDFRLSLFNLILRKSSLKAMSLEEDLNLPFHLPFPSLGKPKENDSKNL
ncbi:MAG: hypothetical protein KKB31_02865, partial [Nanoarchaeota archaeon]|nr:hypothetical protein [Nanoarchaeota archaeon]